MPMPLSTVRRSRCHDFFFTITSYFPENNGLVINAVSKKDWEGTGVIPDIACDSASALAEAHVAAVRAAYEPGESTERLTELVRSLYNPANLSVEKLVRLAGVYEGDRTFMAKDGALHTKQGDGPLLELVPMSATRFRYAAEVAAAVQFELNPTGDVVAVEFQFTDGSVDRRVRLAPISVP